MFKQIILISTIIILNECRPQILHPQLHKIGTTSTTSVPLHIPQNAIPARTTTYQDEYEKLQNRNAHYAFSSDVEDHINDLTQQRSETREGLKVTGTYSYSDGYYKRTVKYLADEKGYRVIGEEAVPLPGPTTDLSGSASVSNDAHGTRISYSVKSVPVPGPVAKIID